jgi:hypothetical protein
MIVAFWLIGAGAARRARAIFAALDSSAAALERAALTNIPTSMDMTKIRRSGLPRMETPSFTVVLGAPHSDEPAALSLPFYREIFRMKRQKGYSD